MKKCIARVVLSPRHKEILDNICRRLGQSESEEELLRRFQRSLTLKKERLGCWMEFGVVRNDGAW